LALDHPSGLILGEAGAVGEPLGLVRDELVPRLSGVLAEPNGLLGTQLAELRLLGDRERRTGGDGIQRLAGGRYSSAALLMLRKRGTSAMAVYRQRVEGRIGVGCIDI
jgi:hypothetical protein